MADTSYLFGSSTPSSLSSTLSDTSSSLPAWLQEYTRGLAGASTAVAGNTYQPYQAPTSPSTYGVDAGRVAGFTDMQNQAFSTAQNTAGSWQPFAGYAGQTLPQAQSSYMNPYVNNVVDRIGQLGQRNLTESLLPQVNSTFTGAGQFGSTRNADFTNRAVRDANESIMGQQSQALNQGYMQAQNAALADLQRQANLGAQVSALGYKDASMLGAFGQQQQQFDQQNLDTAYNDWQQQNNWQKDQLSWLSNIIRGQTMPSTTYNTSAASNAANMMSPLQAIMQGGAAGTALMSPVYSQNPNQQQTTK